MKRWYISNTHLTFKLTDMDEDSVSAEMLRRDRLRENENHRRSCKEGSKERRRFKPRGEVFIEGGTTISMVQSILHLASINSKQLKGWGDPESTGAAEYVLFTQHLAPILSLSFYCLGIKNISKYNAVSPIIL